MKNTKSLIILTIAILATLLFTQCANDGSTEKSSKYERRINIETINGIKIAYVNLDTIMYRYLFALDINKEFISKEERIRATLAAKRKKLEEDISNFEYKCNAKTFTSEDEFINEREDIMKKEQEYIQQRDELYRALESENVAKGEELHDSINSFIKEYNKIMGYDFILTKIGDNIIYANEAFDITNDVIKELNKRYNK